MNAFIMGITGRTGRRIAQLLISQGHTVTGLYRREGQVSQLLEIGAQGVAGDIATITEQDLAKAIVNTDVLVFTAERSSKLPGEISRSRAQSQQSSVHETGLRRRTMPKVLTNYSEGALPKAAPGRTSKALSSRRKA